MILEVKDSFGNLVSGPEVYLNSSYWSTLITNEANTDSSFPNSTVKWYHSRSPYYFHWYAKDTTRNSTNPNEYITTLYVNDGMAPTITLTQPQDQEFELGRMDQGGVAECEIKTPEIEYEEHETKGQIKLSYKITAPTKDGSGQSLIITVGDGEESLWKEILNSEWQEAGTFEKLFFNIDHSPITIHWKVEDSVGNVRGSDGSIYQTITINDSIGPIFDNFTFTGPDSVNWPDHNYELTAFNITPDQSGNFSLNVNKPVVSDNHEVDNNSWQFRGWFDWDVTRWETITDSTWGTNNPINMPDMDSNMTYEPDRRDDYIFYLKVSDEKENTSIAKINIVMVDVWAPTWSPPIEFPSTVTVDLVIATEDGSQVFQVSGSHGGSDAKISTIDVTWPKPIDAFSKNSSGEYALSDEIHFYYRIKRNPPADVAYTSAWTKVTDLADIFSGIDDDLSIIDDTVNPVNSSSIIIQWAVRDDTGNILVPTGWGAADVTWPSETPQSNNWDETTISVVNNVAPVFKVGGESEFNTNTNIHIPAEGGGDQIILRELPNTEAVFTIYVPKVLFGDDSELKVDHISNLNEQSPGNDIYFEYKIIHTEAPSSIDWDAPQDSNPFETYNDSSNLVRNNVDEQASQKEIEATDNQISNTRDYPSGEGLTFQYGNIPYSSQAGAIFNVYWRAKYGLSGAWSNNFAFYKIQFKDNTIIEFSSDIFNTYDPFVTNTGGDYIMPTYGGNNSMTINVQSQSVNDNAPRLTTSKITVMQPFLEDEDQQLGEHTYKEISFRHNNDWNAGSSDDNWVDEDTAYYINGASPASVTTFSTALLKYGKTEIQWIVANKVGSESTYKKTINIYNVKQRAPVFSDNSVNNWWNSGGDPYEPPSSTYTVQVGGSTVEDAKANNIHRKVFTNNSFSSYYHQSGASFGQYGTINENKWEYEIEHSTTGDQFLFGGDESASAVNSTTFFFQTNSPDTSYEIKIKWKVEDSDELKTSNSIIERGFHGCHSHQIPVTYLNSGKLWTRPAM